GKATVTFTAKDAHKNALANTIVYLSLNQVENGGVATVGETALTKEPQPFATDATGNVSINYTAPASLPGGGIDTITIQDAPTNPHVKATNSYTFTALSKLVYSASTLAATGTLKANDQTTVTVQAQDAAKHPLANTIVYLSVQSPGGIALVGDTALTATPQAFVTNEAGLISITYTAPQTLPNGGTVSVIAQETTNKPHVKASSSYTFAKISKWVGNATIAATGSLKAGDKQTVTMVVQDASKHPIGHTTVYLSLTSTGTGGGKAMVGDTALNGTLQAFTTDDFGQIIITYIASDLLPHRVTDTITCADSTKKTVRATTTYTY
ncbi:MAG: hypothetical protein ACXVP5_07820, partial [Tumebacillaceae bacterium]